MPLLSRLVTPSTHRRSLGALLFHDSKSPRDAPRWLQIPVRLVRVTRLLGLAEMRAAPSLASMRVLQRGNRLSITPVTADEWAAVLALLGR